MSTVLTPTQIEKFRALGKASRDLAKLYSKGEGPDPVSGSTFKNGVPMCTWGQVLHKAGYQPIGTMANNSSNANAFADFIGELKLATASSTKGVAEEGIFEDTIKTYDLKKIHALGTKIMNANDPAPTAAERKARTHKMLDELADAIEEEFGQIDEYKIISFESAAEQHLQRLISGDFE